MHKAPLSTIAHINPPLPRKIRDDEIVSFVGMQDVSEGGVLQKQEAMPFSLVKNGFTRFIENDVLFAKITPCMENGKGAIATGLSNKIGCGSTEFHVLRANEDGSHQFIFHVSMSDEFRQKAEMNMTGSAGQRRVPSDFFRKYSIYIPEKSEQQKIAHILTTVDNLIEKTQALIDKYTAVKQGMMHDLFTRGIDLATGQLRPSYEQAPQLYKATELGWVPKEWEIKKFKDITSILTCGVAATPIYVEEGAGFSFLSAQNVKNGKVNLDKLSYIPHWLHERLTKYNKPKIGDILYSRVGAGFGEAAVVEIAFEFSVYVSLTHIRMKNGYDPYFYKYLLNTPQIKNKAGIDVFQGGGVPNLNVGEVREFLLPSPVLNEQIAISRDLKNIDEFIHIQQMLNQKYQLQKKGLMQDLLTGKVSVNV